MTSLKRELLFLSAFEWLRAILAIERSPVPLDPISSVLSTKSYCKYNKSASEAATVNVACPPDTFVDSNVSVPCKSQVPLANVCPPKVGLLPSSTLEEALAAVSLLDFSVPLPSPARTKFTLPLVPLPE